MLEALNCRYVNTPLSNFNLSLEFRFVKGVIKPPPHDTKQTHSKLAERIWHDLLVAFSETLDQTFSNLDTHEDIVNYFIYGSSDFALTLKDFLDFHDMKFCGFIDDFRTGDSIIGTFADTAAFYNPLEYEIVLGIGYNNLPARLKAFKRIQSAGFKVATLIHRCAFVRSPANIHEGAIIMANATIDGNAVVGEAVVVWPGVVVNHDSIISANTFLSPSATICGFVNVGENCFVGAGAVVSDHINVPNGTFIKANALYKGG